MGKERIKLFTLLGSRTTTETFAEEKTTMNARIPAEVFAPGEFLREELESRGWSQMELSEILDRPPRLISEIIAGKRAITPETAKGLAAAFGTSAQFWMNLETSYQLSKAKIEELEVSRRAQLYGMFPVKELLKRGWIEASENIDVLEQRFLEFFDIKSLDEKSVFAHAAKRTVYEGATIIQLAWLNRAKQVSKAVSVSKFSIPALREVIAELRGHLEYVDAICDVPKILAKVGVRLVIVEHLAGAKMDAACFWLNDSSPVIALSLRFDRVDNFWHNLFHEIDHVLHEEGKDKPIFEIIESDKDWDNLPAIERRANDAAANNCVPKNDLDGFIVRVNPLFSKQAILGFARRLNVHPGIIVGQLQKRKLIPYSFHRELLEKIKAIVTSSVLTDGFGNK